MNQTPNPFEIERKYLVVGDDWRDAVRTSTHIAQRYLPPVMDNDVRLFIAPLDGSSNQIGAIAIHPESGILWIQPIPDHILKKFGIENLPHLTNVDGLVRVDGDIHARVRLKGDAAFVTIKRPAGKAGKNYELEFPIERSYAEIILPFCDKGIGKMRHEIPFGDLTIEVDEFDGLNRPLVMAEIEVLGEDEIKNPPAWLGLEVTGDKRYSNNALAAFPYSSWGLGLNGGGPATSVEPGL